MSRIMIMANGPWVPTGYGIQGKYLAQNLISAGHDVAYFAFYGLQGAKLETTSYPVYPGGFYDAWGTDVLEGHMADFEADTLITIFDPWVTPNVGNLVKKNGWRWLPWTPVDSYPVSPRAAEFLKPADKLMCFSAWGVKVLKEAGFDNAIYAPLGVSDIFKPNGMDKPAARAVLGFPEDSFVIGMVAANRSWPSRKAFPQQLQAFVTLRERHPNTYMYLHTCIEDKFQGVNLGNLVAELGIEDYVRWPNQYRYLLGYPEEDMPIIYGGMDCFTSVSMNEGFGVPIIEAQACGTPVIAGGWTSMPELVESGIIVEGHQKAWTILNTWVYEPLVSSIVTAYETMYETVARDNYNPEFLSLSMEKYRWHNVIQPWLGIL